MKEDTIDEYLNVLQNIQKAETPLFLFTRIEEQIKNKLSNRVSPKTARALFLSFLFLLIINFFVIIHTINKSDDFDKEKNLVQSLQLLPDNNLYQ